MGYGCDVLVHVGQDVPEFWRFGLQAGSVLLWEPPQGPQSYRIRLPEGIVIYPLPLTDLCARYDEGLASKGLAALAVLLYLLGLPEELLRHLTSSVAASRSFAAGLAFARRMITKRDAYSLPCPATSDDGGRMMLTSKEAIMLGYAVSSCECGTNCDDELLQSPTQWVAKHTEIAGEMVSVLQSERHPGVEAYRGPQGKVLALLGGHVSAIPSCFNGFETSHVLVSADIADALRLLVIGHDLVRRGFSGVGILIEESVAELHQSVELSSMVDLVRGRGLAADFSISVQSDFTGQVLEPDGDVEADVGLVAWGAAQGVVRDAVALCRSFGLHVAGLYPKVIVPFPKNELEAFARRVKRVVLVESSWMQGYGDRLVHACSFKPSMLRPLPGKTLTPIDIFLREGLGTG
jgi:hypothetical protein